MLYKLQDLALYIFELIYLIGLNSFQLTKAIFTKKDVKEKQVIFAGDLSDLGFHKIGILICNRTIKKEPDFPRAYFERAMAKLELNRYDESILDFKKCLELDSDYPGAKQWLQNSLEFKEKSNNQFKE